MSRSATLRTILAALVVLAGALSTRASASPVSTGTWASAGNLSSARAGAATVLLQDGRILFTGGTGANGPLASAEFFNTDGSISGAPPMQTVRANHTATVLQDGRVLVAGGTTSGGSVINAAEIYDPTANTWTEVSGGMVVPRSGHTASLLSDGTVLIAGGQNAGVATNSLEIFDPGAGTFTLAPDTLSSPRQGHAAAVLQNGLVLIVGGSDGMNALNSSDLYDPSTGLLNPGPSLLTSRQGLSATTQLDGKALVVGGNNGAADLASAEVYDPATGNFTATGPLSIARQGHLAYLLPHNGGILIFGGTSGGVAQASAELYYPWTGAFNSTGAMASARSGAAGSPLNQGGLLLVAGGTDATGNTLSSAELYGFATITTDKKDYQPGETVTITGSGWQPGETVTLSFVESPLFDTHPSLTAVADASGNIVNTQFSPDVHDLETLFYLTATGSTSQAQTIFTDGTAANGDGSMVVSPTIVAAGSTGNTLTFTFTAQNGKDFNAGSQATIQVPAGWTAPTSGNVTVTKGSCSTATLATITGSGPWTIPINMTCPGGDSFTVAYSGATAPASAGTNTFTTKTKQNGGTLTNISGQPTVTVQAASTLVFGQQPTNTQAGSPITPALTVEVQDANGDLVNTSTASVTIAIANNPGGGTLSGTATVNAVNGIATFSNLSINKTGTGYTLSATSAGLTSATSSAFNITPGSATQLVFGQQPTSTQAGSPITPAVTVRVLDANNNLVTTGTGSTASITMAIGTNPSGGTLSGTTTVAASGGIAAFSNLSIDKVGTGYTLTASSAGLTSATSSAFNITTGAVSAATSTVSANPTSVTADGSTTSTITVTLLDAGSNPVSGKTVSLTAGSGSSIISAASGPSNASGVVTFTVKDTKAEAVTYTAKDTTDTITITETATVTFTAGAVSAAISTVSANPTSVVADGVTTSTITVTLKDANSNPVSGKSVTLAQGTGTSTISAASGSSNSSGVVTFTVKDTKVEAVTYTATDATDSTTVTATATVNFTVGTVSAAASTVAANPTSVTADGATTSTITVTLQDANNHPVSGKTVTLTAGGGSSTITTVNGTTNAAGQATFTVKDGTVESVIYTAKDTTDTITITQTATVNFTVGPVSPTTSTVSANPTSLVADGTSTSTITVTLRDANNHPVSGKAVSLTAGGGSSTITTVSGTTNASGVATFTVKDSNVESVTYTGSDTSDAITITQTATVTFTVGPGNATTSTVSANPTSVAADGVTTSTITVTLKDASSRAVSGKTVTLAQGAGSSIISAASGASNSSGVVTFTVKDSKGEVVTYTATDTTDSITITQTAQVTFNNPVPTTTSISPASKNAGDALFTLTVNGTNFVATSTVNFNGSARTTTFGSSTQVTATITAADVATAGAFPITVTNAAPGGGTSNAQTLTVNPKLAFTTSAFATLTGFCSPQVSVQIQNGNGSAATLATATVLNLSSTAGSGSFYSDAACGTPLPGNNVTIAAGSSTGSFFYKDTTVGTPSITAASTGLTSIQQTEAITGLRFGSTAFSVPVGQCSSAISLQSANAASGNPTSLTQTTTINLSSSSTGGKFFSDSACTVQITSTVIGPGNDAGHDSPNFFYRDSLAGSPALTASAGTASTTQSETISKATPVFSNLTASQSIAYGTPSVTLSGNIASGSLFPPTTENVSITINGVTVQAVIGASGAFSTSFDTHAIPASASPYTITYSYAGDVNFNTATNTSTTLTVTKANTTTVVGTISPEPSNINQQYSVNWTVSPVAPSTGTPTGTVTVNDGNGNTCSAPVASGACSLASTSSGTKSITATYSGDSNFNGSSGTKSHLVNNPATMTTVTSSSVNNTSNYGDLVTFNATVTSAGGTPTGSISFYEGACGGTALSGPTNLDVNGKASFSTNTLAVMSHTITACYTPTGIFLASSGSVTQTVNQAAPVVMDNGPPASTYGQPVTLSVTVTPPSGGAPTGTVTFSFTQNSTTSYVCADGSISTTQCTVPVTLSGGSYVASVTTSHLPTAADNVMATYSGDTDFQGEPANNLSVTVSQASSATTLTKSVDPSIYGDAVDLTVKVKDNTSNSTGVPTGTVALSFQLDPTNPSSQLYYLCADGSILTTACAAANQITLAPDATDPLGLTATATVHTSNLPAGLSTASFAYAINATYSGDTNFSASGPFGLSQTVNQRPITVMAATDTKTYDGTTSSVGVPTITTGSLANTDTGNFTQTFDNRNAATGKTLTPAGSVNDGFGGNDYIVTFTPVSTGVIKALAITVTAVADKKTYDGTASSSGKPTIAPALISPDSSGFTQSFDTKNVSTGKTLTASGSANDGSAGNNYAVTFVNNTSGEIDAAGLTITAVANTKTYDSTASAAATPTLAGLQIGDTVTGLSETYDTKNAGTGKTLSVATYTVNDGNSGHNYAVTTPTNGNGVINKAPLTVTAVTNTKSYDATTSAAATPTVLGLQGSSDTVTGLSETYDTPDAGTGKTLSVATYMVNDGYGGGNYAVTLVANTTGVIIQAVPVVIDNGPPTSTYGQPVTLSVTVTPPSGGIPMGTVTFSFTQNATTYYVCASGSISTTQCTVPVTPSGGSYVASVTTSNLPTAADNVMATYSGDADFQGEQANNISVTVSQANSATTLTKSVDPSTYGDAVDLTVKVKDSTTNSTGLPTGTVTLSFKLDPSDATAQLYYICLDGSISTTACVSGNQITLAPDATDNTTATATVHTSYLPAGLSASSFAYAINAAYSGDTNFMASGPVGLAQTVNQRAITVTAATDTKTYDGTTSSSAKPTVTTGSLANTDTGNFTQTFDNRNAGTGKTLTPAGSVNDGFGGNNYIITFTPVSTGAINQLAISVTAVTDSKTYDGTTSSSQSPSIAPALVGGDTSGFSQKFDTRNVGTNKTLAPSGSVNDANGGLNYAVTFHSVSTGSIATQAITVTAVADSKTYDGTTSSKGVPTISPALASGDTSGFTQTFDNRNAGVSKTLTPSGLANDGNGGNNYAVSFVPVNTGVISALPITVTAVADSKTYDGTTSSAGVPTIAPALIIGDTSGFAQAFDNRNAGMNKALTPSGSAKDNNSGNNYAVTFVQVNTGAINALAITVTAVADSKTYDGTTSSAGIPTIAPALISGDTPNFRQRFDTKNVGSGKTLTPSGYVADGNGGKNYTASFVPVSNGIILQLAITVTAMPDSKTYDGTIASGGVPTIAPALVSGDTSAFFQTFDSKNAGARILVPMGTANDGNGGQNYNVKFVNAAGAISQRPLTITAATNTKTYDGTTSAAATPTFVGLQGSDTVTGLSETYDTPNAGTSKTLSVVSYTVNDGKSGGNYSVTLVADNTGVILQATPTVTDSGPSGSIYGQPVTLSVTVAPPDGGTPTGTVTFSFTQGATTYYVCADGSMSTIQCTVPVTWSGSSYVASVSTSKLPTAADHLMATYSGDTNFVGETANTISVTVSHADSATTLTSSEQSATYGDGVDLTVKVKDNTGNSTGVPTGTVALSFKLDPADPAGQVYNICADGTLSTTACASPNQITLAPDAGDPAGVTATATVHTTMLPAGLTVQAFVYSITASYSGDMNFKPSLPFGLAQTVNQRPITVTAATDTKTYDGNTSSIGKATVTTGSLANTDTGNFTQTFDNRNAASGKTLTPAGSVNDGFVGNNYVITFTPANTGTISPLAITVTAIADKKIYDGTTTSAGVPTIAPALISPDSSGFTQSFSTKNVGTGKTLTPSGSASDGNHGGNYAVTFTPVNSGEIDQAALTITAVSNTKVYDGTTTAAAKPTVSGTQTGDSVVGLVEAYDTKNVGTGKTLSVTAYTVNDGNAGGNYTVTKVPTATGVITQAALTVNAAGVGKVYDGTAVATVNLSDNRIAGDVFTDSYATATFVSANAGTGIPVSVSGISISGTDAGNYTFNTTTNTAATIAQATTATSITSVTNPSTWGLVAVFTAAVAPQIAGTPTGTVLFYNAASGATCSALGSSTQIDTPALFNGMASTSTAWLPVGTDKILACYGGDPNFVSSSGTVPQTVLAAPIAVVSPASGLSFGNQQVGTTSGVQTVTVSNPNGTASLSISNVAITGTNASYFTQTNNCATVAAVTGSCTISIKFSPADTGAASAILTVTDNNENASGSQQSVPLVGAAISTISSVGSLSTYAIFATANGCNSINGSGNISVDSFNSSMGYASSHQNSGGNIGTDGNVTLSGNAAIYGSSSSPFAGGGTCSAKSMTGFSTSGKASATGGELQLAQPLTYPAPPPPNPAPPTSSQNISGSCGSISGCTNTGSKTVTLAPGQYGNLSLSGGTSAHVTAGTYNVNSLTLSGNSTLVVDSGPVILNVAGSGLGANNAALDLSGGSMSNTSGIPRNLQIYYGGSLSIKLSGGSGAYAVVYAPKSPINVSGGTDFYGSIVGSTVNDSGNTAIHYDASLPAISAGNYLWFNSAGLNVQGVPSTGNVKLYVTNASIAFKANNTTYNLPVPDAVITFSPTATSASTTWDSTNSRWTSLVPTSLVNGNATIHTFLDGLAFLVPSGGFPGGIQNATWSAAFSTDTPGISFQWQWGAAVYNSSFTNTYPGLGVNAVDGADPAGTPENYKSDLVFGATGAGPTGLYVGTAGVVPTIAEASASPSSLDFSSGGTVNQKVGTTSGSMTATLTNNQSVPLTISNVQITGADPGDFAQTNTCPISPNTLAGGGSCIITVTFTPTAVGKRTASIAVTDGANNSPQTVFLKGIGVSQ